MSEQFGTSEQANEVDSIVADNLAFLEFTDFPVGEFVGSGRTTLRDRVWDCSLHHGYADRRTGQITMMGNPFDAEEAVRKHDGEFQFWVAAAPQHVAELLQAGHTIGSTIVKVFAGEGTFSPKALGRLQETAWQYNDHVAAKNDIY